MKEENNKSTIGNNIKRLRLEHGISQDVLSKKTDLAFHTISKIESGSTPDPRIETLRKIANAFGVGVDDLLK